MATALFTHETCLKHENGPGHPECPERLAAVLEELKKPAYTGLLFRQAPRAAREQIARVHEPAYMDAILNAVPRSGYAPLDPDTSLSPGSGEAALRAAGAVTAAVDEVVSGRISNAFCAVRPPGHHAERARPMGFCLFGNIAVGAAHALDAHNLGRVAILDFDVHHGNGTQAWAEGEERALFVSSHQSPLWPGTGQAAERGPHNNIVNLPLPPGSGGDAFRAAMRGSALPRVAAFGPEMIFISAGFDAHRDDPLAGLRFVEEDFAWITRELCKLAGQYCGGRVVSSLEGGYDPAALAASAGAHVKALMEA